MNTETKELRRLNNELDKELSPENDIALTDIICYLRVANISEYNQEMIRQDLLEMVLSAQQRGEDIASVIGEDYKTFCDNIIANIPHLGLKEKIVELVDTVLLSASILGIIFILTSKDTVLLISNLVAGKTFNYHISMSVGVMISYGLIIVASYLVIQYISKNSFTFTKRKNKLRDFCIGAGITLLFLLLAWLGRSTLFTVHIVTAAIIVAMLFVAHKVMTRYI